MEELNTLFLLKGYKFSDFFIKGIPNKEEIDLDKYQDFALSKLGSLLLTYTNKDKYMLVINEYHKGNTIIMFTDINKEGEGKMSMMPNINSIDMLNTMKELQHGYDDFSQKFENGKLSLLSIINQNNSYITLFIYCYQEEDDCHIKISHILRDYKNV